MGHKKCGKDPSSAKFAGGAVRGYGQKGLQHPGFHAEQAKETAYGFIDRSDTEYDLVLLDLPGTVNTTGVFQSIINMDYVFTPITQERMVMQSSMSFVLSIREYLLHHKGVPLRDIHMFWNKMDKRVSRDLYDAYMEIIRSLGLPVLNTVLPAAERYKKDVGLNGQIFRSTLFPPSAAALKGSNLDLLAAEMETIRLSASSSTL